MEKIVRLTESDLIRIVRRVIKEQEEELDEDWIDDVATASGPLGAGVAKLFGRDEPWKNYVKVGGYLYKYLGMGTNHAILKTLFDATPVGILKSMSLAAAKGDANSLSQAFNQASKYVKTDLTQLKNAAFKDMKSFGNLLLNAGVK